MPRQFLPICSMCQAFGKLSGFVGSLGPVCLIMPVLYPFFSATLPSPSSQSRGPGLYGCCQAPLSKVNNGCRCSITVVSTCFNIPCGISPHSEYQAARNYAFPFDKRIPRFLRAMPQQKKSYLILNCTRLLNTSANMQRCQ